MNRALTEMVEPKAPVISDLNGSQEHEPLGCLGWAATIGLCCILAFFIFDGVRKARADAPFRRQMAQEEREMKALLSQLARGNAEQRRIAAEIRAMQAQGGSR